MRILFDAYELIPGEGKSIGIYHYAKNLLHALVDVADDQSEIVVLCNEANIQDFSLAHPAFRSVVCGKKPGKVQRLLWFFLRAAWLSAKWRPDVYFSPKGFLPKAIKLFSGKTATVVVIHDLIPLWYQDHYPGHFGRAEELYINQSLVASALGADRIIAISQATADDIASRLVRDGGVFVVHNGIPMTVPQQHPNLPPFIFGMASALPHKNAAGLLAAYAAYRTHSAHPLPLIVCGIADPNQPGVRSVGGLGQAELHGYYAQAELFVFLSLVEGFGFPPVEALGHGTTVLCSDIAPLREVAGPLANYVAPDDAELAGRKMAELTALKPSDEIRQQRMAILQRYSWQACAQGVWRVITGA